MTEDEIEAVAEELAKAGGVSWYPGREGGTLLKVVSDRYRDRARLAIAALDRYRAQRQALLLQTVPKPNCRQFQQESRLRPTTPFALASLWSTVRQESREPIRAGLKRLKTAKSIWCPIYMPGPDGFP